jgi:hypothetical protein
MTVAFDAVHAIKRIRKKSNLGFSTANVNSRWKSLWKRCVRNCEINHLARSAEHLRRDRMQFSTAIVE